MDSTSDNALMVKVKNGDLDQLGLLFDRYHQRLFGFFYRLTFRKEECEDLVQGVFERILKYRYTYNSGGEFSTWIFSIARNHVYDYYRKNGADPVEHYEIDLDAVSGDPLAAEDPTEQEQNSLLVKKALLKLDPDKRQVLVLSRFEGFRYSEIAEIIGCTEGAVKVRVFRALNELRDILTEVKKKEEL